MESNRDPRDIRIAALDGKIKADDIASIQTPAHTGVEAMQRQVDQMVQEKQEIEGFQSATREEIRAQEVVAQKMAAEVHSEERKNQDATYVDGVLRSELYMLSRDEEKLDWDILREEANRENEQRNLSDADEENAVRSREIESEKDEKIGEIDRAYRTKFDEIDRRENEEFAKIRLELDQNISSIVAGYVDVPVEDAATKEHFAELKRIVDENVADIGEAKVRLDSDAINADSRFFGNNQQADQRQKEVQSALSAAEAGKILTEGKIKMVLTDQAIKEMGAKFQAERDALSRQKTEEVKKVSEDSAAKQAEADKILEEKRESANEKIEVANDNITALEEKRGEVRGVRSVKEDELRRVQEEMNNRELRIADLNEDLKSVLKAIDVDRVVLRIASEEMGKLAEKGVGAIAALESLDRVIDNRMVDILAAKAGVSSRVNESFSVRYRQAQEESERRAAEVADLYTQRKEELKLEMFENYGVSYDEKGLPMAEGYSDIELSLLVSEAIGSVGPRLKEAMKAKESGLQEVQSELNSLLAVIKRDARDSEQLLVEEFGKAAEKLNDAKSLMLSLKETANNVFGSAAEVATDQAADVPAEQQEQTSGEAQKQKGLVKSFVGFFVRLFKK